jgi:hypothetical protein
MINCDAVDILVSGSTGKKQEKEGQEKEGQEKEEKEVEKDTQLRRRYPPEYYAEASKKYRKRKMHLTKHLKEENAMLKAEIERLQGRCRELAKFECQCSPTVKGPHSPSSNCQEGRFLAYFDIGSLAPGVEMVVTDDPLDGAVSSEEVGMTDFVVIPRQEMLEFPVELDCIDLFDHMSDTNAT